MAEGRWPATNWFSRWLRARSRLRVSRERRFRQRVILPVRSNGVLHTTVERLRLQWVGSGIRLCCGLQWGSGPSISLSHSGGAVLFLVEKIVASEWNRRTLFHIGT